MFDSIAHKIHAFSNKLSEAYENMLV